MIEPFDVERTVLAQYANSPTLRGLVEDIWLWLDQADQLNLFFDLVWNIETAQGFGLDIWGRILGVGRVYPIGQGKYFGYAEQGTDFTFAYPYGEGIFFAGDLETLNFRLSDEVYRRLLLAKAYANIIDGGSYSINRLLQLMFPGRGNVYVVDNNDMSMTYKFEFDLTPIDLTLVQNAGILPQPAGVAINVDAP